MRTLRGKLTLREAGDKIGISHTYLSHLEKGVDPRSGKEISVSVETLKLIADGYNYPFDKLMVAAGYLPKEREDSSRAPSDQVPTPTTTRLDLKQIEELLETGIPIDLGDGTEATPEDKDFLLRIVRSMLRDKK